MDAVGLVTGEPNPAVLRQAKETHIPVLPIVALFDKDVAHKLLYDFKAQDEMNAAFVRECKEDGYAGISSTLRM